MGKLTFVIKDAPGSFELDNVDIEETISIQKLVAESNGKGFLQKEGLYSIRMDSILLINYLQ